MSEDVPTLVPSEAYALWATNYPPRAHNPLMLAEERALLALLPADLGGRMVLDAGCGSGRYIAHAYSRRAKHVLGVDLSREMLARARFELQDLRSESSAVVHSKPNASHVELIQGGLEALPVREAWADLAICGLTIGHLERLEPVLEELRRVTRPGGTILCSDFHPVGHALGWRREFTAEGRRYAVRHTPHLAEDWRRACAALGLAIERVLEPMLDPADIPTGARFDPVALTVPVAIVFELRHPASYE
jgi:malonyl-CoA O-methyltransferase